MIKEREQILEKLSIIFQVFLTILCFDGARWLTHRFFVPVQGDMTQYRSYYL